ncbi:MAG: hypothetical protein ACE15C_16805 [Phycisphaerae bacterium]
MRVAVQGSFDYDGGQPRADSNEVEVDLAAPAAKGPASAPTNRPSSLPTTTRSADSEVPWTKAVNGLECRLLLDTPVVPPHKGAAGTMKPELEPRVFVTFQVRNVAQEVLNIHPGLSALQGESTSSGATFRVMGHEGKEARYLGVYASPILQGPSDFIIIGPGQVRTNRVSLPYDYSLPGSYEISTRLAAGTSMSCRTSMGKAPTRLRPTPTTSGSASWNPTRSRSRSRRTQRLNRRQSRRRGPPPVSRYPTTLGNTQTDKDGRWVIWTVRENGVASPVGGHDTDWVRFCIGVRPPRDGGRGVDPGLLVRNTAIPDGRTSVEIPVRLDAAGPTTSRPAASMPAATRP